MKSFWTIKMFIKYELYVILDVIFIMLGTFYKLFMFIDQYSSNSYN